VGGSSARVFYPSFIKIYSSHKRKTWFLIEG
jgi:hypothetical protein